MRRNGRFALTIATALLAAAGPLLSVGSASAASTTTPWEPDTTNEVGSLTLFNASGDAITSGTDLTHLFDYAEASTTDAQGGTKAFIQFAQPTAGTDVDNPTSGTSNPGSWPVSNPSGTVPFPVTTPASLASSPNPVATIATSDAGGNLQSFINQSNQPATTSPLYGIWQIRLYTTGGGLGTANANPSQYWAADVKVTAGTGAASGSWTEVYPTAGVAATPTTTVVTASPAKSAKQGASVVITATVAATGSATPPAGTVQFYEDGLTIGTAQTVNTTTGTATLTTKTLLPSAPGAAKITALFTPADSATYAQSTSAALAYTIDPILTKTPTLSGTHKAGAKETCSVGSLDFGVTATYTWKAGSAKVGSGKTLVVPGSAYKKALTCSVTVHAGSGPSSASLTSKAVTVSLGAALKATKKPTLSGSHKVGKVETVKKGTWSEKVTKYTYQWYAGSSKIPGATKSTLKLKSSEAGKKLTCKVTATATGFASGSATTASVKVSS